MMVLELGVRGEGVGRRYNSRTFAGLQPAGLPSIPGATRLKLGMMCLCAVPSWRLPSIPGATRLKLFHQCVVVRILGLPSIPGATRLKLNGRSHHWDAILLPSIPGATRLKL